MASTIIPSRSPRGANGTASSDRTPRALSATTAARARSGTMPTSRSLASDQQRPRVIGGQSSRAQVSAAVRSAAASPPASARARARRP